MLPHEIHEELMYARTDDVVDDRVRQTDQLCLCRLAPGIPVITHAIVDLAANLKVLKYTRLDHSSCWSEDSDSIGDLGLKK